MQQAVVFRIEREQQTAGKKKISNEYSYFSLPEGLNRIESSSLFRVVDHIVVNQSGRVEQLDKSRGSVRGLRYPSASLGGKKYQ